MAQYQVADLVNAGPIPWRVRATDASALGVTLANLGISAEPPGEQGTILPPMYEEQAADLLTALVSAGVRVVTFGPVGGHLESAYLALTEERL